MAGGSKVSNASELPRDFTAIRRRVVSALKKRLRQTGSSLLSDPFVEHELVDQVTKILADTFVALDKPVPQRFAQPSVADRDANSDATEVGGHRAKQNIHPVESLHAATQLFDVAFSELGDTSDPPFDSKLVARALHIAIMSNVIPASVAYVNVLLERLAVAHTEERLGISRDLHDRVAHGIAAGIQRISLSQIASRTNDTSSNQELMVALDLLTDALDETRAIALELRHFVGEKFLDEALVDYVADSDDDRSDVLVATIGNRRKLPSGVQEEAFIIVREAIQNARQHSNATTIEVSISWSTSFAEIAVRDNGHGFQHADVRSGALGLIAAQERAELIGADLKIDPGYGSGTTVTLTIPTNRGY
jgi:signal transduction histidine kinase